MTDHLPPDEPIFARPLVLAESDQTDASTWSSPPKRKTIPRRIASLVGKLGLRFEPSVKADLDAHAARVALLAEDLCDCDPDNLELAIGRWVASKPFLPKASELREIIAELNAPKAKREYADVVGIANARLEAEGSHLRWAWNNPDDRGAGTHLTSIGPIPKGPYCDPEAA